MVIGLKVTAHYDTPPAAHLAGTVIFENTFLGITTMNLIQKLEQTHLEQVTEGKNIPEFAAGDTVRVNVRIVEGTTERVQAFEGVVIARKNRGLHSSFSVRKISHGEGVERTFPLFSPRLESITVVRRGDVRRAKLFYLRDRSGKSARIKEKRDYAHEASKAAKDASNKAATAAAKKA